MRRGTGFIIFNDGNNKFIGMTNRHVWDRACESTCWIAFPSNDEFTEWTFHQATLYSENIAGETSTVFSADEDGAKTFPGDYALFSFEGDEDLEPLELSFVEAPEHAFVTTIGYPSQIYSREDRSSHTDSDSPRYLVKSEGVIDWTEEYQFNSTAAVVAGSSGSPVFVWIDGKPFVNALVYKSSDKPQPVEIGSQISARRSFNLGMAQITLSNKLIHAAVNHPKHTIFTKLKRSAITGKPKTADNLMDQVISISVTPKTLSKGRLTEEGINFKLTVKKSISDWSKLYFNGISVEAFDDFQVNHSTDSTAISFYTSLNEAFVLSKFEYLPKDANPYHMSCVIGDIWETIGAELGDFDIVDEYLESQDNKKWTQPKYKRLIDASKLPLEQQQAKSIYCRHNRYLPSEVLSDLWNNGQ